MGLAAILALAGGAGCEYEAPTLSLRSGRTLLGYGRAASWALDLDLLKADLRLCHASGIDVYTVSLLGWWGFSMPDAADPRIRDMTQAAYATLVNQCRLLGMVALVDIHNQNSGSGKYGERGRPLDDPAEIALIDWGIDLVRRQGPDNVVVIPCREASQESGFAIERKCVERLKGFQLCANTRTRPWPPPAWAGFAEWHPESAGEVPPSGAVVTSDSGPVLHQLCAGAVDGPGRPDAVREWMRAGVEQRNPARIFFTLYSGPLDSATLRAIGEAAPGPTGTDPARVSSARRRP